MMNLRAVQNITPPTMSVTPPHPIVPPAARRKPSSEVWGLVAILWLASMTGFASSPQTQASLLFTLATFTPAVVMTVGVTLVHRHLRRRAA